ncbi:hypothetical protein ZTR_02974 [Talaromyces verruculosus]|nr:hypothetical protein ZTR_02974 [Talaromyces verruculosus]
MANQVPLITYVQSPLPAIPINPTPNPGRNTTNTAYKAEDIQNITVWHDFSLNTILQRYHNVLVQARLPPNPLPNSPPAAIVVETLLRDAVAFYVFPRVRRSLRAAFAHLAGTPQGIVYITAVSIGGGEIARNIRNYRPDVAMYDLALPEGSGPNRAPGDTKPSWKWDTAMAHDARAFRRM